VGHISYGKVGYLGNLMVQPEQRGIGAALINEAMEHLLISGVKSIRFDSVPKAISFYKHLEFKGESLSLRFTGETPKKGATRCMRMDEKDLPEVAELDLKLFEAPRAKVLRRVLNDFPQHYF